MIDLRQFRLRRLGLCVCFLPWALVSAKVEGQATEAIRSELRLLSDSELPSLVALYQIIHANPELSFQEKETSSRVARELQKAGFEVTPNVGGYGVVGLLGNGEGPTVMIRTDMDALPVVEQTGLSYASKVQARDDDGNEVGVMHACGHDLHIASFIGTARILSALRGRWRGTLLMVAQPAEERGAGAKAMLEEGLFTRFPRPDFALALHVDSSLPAGQIAYTPGYAMANVDSVDITIRGVGGHGAYPDTTKDPIVIAAQVVMALQTIVSREVRPNQPAVVTVGSIHGGTKHNIISDQVKMELTVRSYTDEVRKQILSAIRRITLGIAEAAGVPEDRKPIVTIKDEYTPATYNDPELVRRATRAMADFLGADSVVEREAMMGGEDFGRYGREEPRIPIFLFRLGSIGEERFKDYARQGRTLPSLHSALYYPDVEPTLKTGMRAMTIAALELLHYAGDANSVGR